ncbi:response regulator transcription factor [Paenibacillus senegalensis]|uniref:response regulator transcription factor n=1 Tax=Paenibacillus senegalensis TaxID=1465766 RepID=UPI00028981E4|nr:response regulator [Paenibacillus senegalensis]
MKVLIVDDEQHVREAIRLLVDWEELAIEKILEAHDAQSAMAIMEKEQPEIVFTDMMMPGQSGVELMEWIQETYGQTKVIVVSGHDDFEFVRGAVKYGGLDYILKPIDPDDLQAAVSKAVSQRRKEDQEKALNKQHTIEMAIEMNQIKPVYRDKLFSHLLDEPDYYFSLEDQLCLEYGLPQETGISCRSAILSLDTMEKGVRSKFSSHLELLFFSLINICNEYLRKEQSGVAFRYWNNRYEIVLLLWKRLDAAPSLLHTLNEAFCKALGGQFEFGLGTAKAFPHGLPSSYREAAEALKRRDLLKRHTWIHCYSNAAEDEEGASLHFTDYEETIRFALLSGREEQIEQAVGEWFRAVGSLPSIRLKQVEQWMQEYNILRKTWLEPLSCPDPAESGGGKTFTALPLNEQGKLSLDRWKKELTGQLLTLSKQLAEERQRKQNVIYEIEQYIRRHFDEDVSLQEIANRFYLSREYISRRFKQEFKVNYSDFVTDIRISKAKELLRSPDLKISEVAGMVGFPDDKYFSKVFKKVVGLSPNDYRKRMEKDSSIRPAAVSSLSEGS